MSLEQGAGAVAVAAIAMYTIFGGADFGGGIWSLLAWGPRKTEQRNVLERAIGPVWETNHVWLILLVVTLFVAFPTAYAAIFAALYVPLFIALLGVVARGAAFAFRNYGDHKSRLSLVSLRFFSAASAVTPFTFGLVVGGVTGGHIAVDGATVDSGAFAGWLEPFSLMCGVIALLLCAFLAAAYMIPRTEGALRQDFRRRAIASSIALGLATTAAIPVAHWNAPAFSTDLTRASVVGAMGVTAALGLATLASLWRGDEKRVPLLAAGTATGVVVAWALAQNPHLVAPGLSLHAAAAPSITLKSFLISLHIGALILVPSLALLYGTFSRDVLKDGGGRQSH
ncbi:MAG TPA: cytochrome d ubiquinol oxidase subunit II [Tepidiformaceae bacterium]